MSKKKRRLIPIVDRGFQMKYTAIIVSVAALVAVALGYFLLSAYAEMNAMLEISAAVNDQMNSDDAKKVFRLVVGFLAFLVVALGFLGVFITHRVCGPIAVLHGNFNVIEEGGYPQPRPLRKGDEFSDAFGAFSKMVDALKARDQSEMDALRAALTDGDADALKTAVNAVVEQKDARLKNA